MQHGQTLFMLQTELIDKKVEISMNNNLDAVNNSIINLREEVRNSIISLREEMISFRHEIKQEMIEFRHEFGTRLAVVEALLGKRFEKQTEIRNRFFDFCFKAGWALLVALLVGGGSFLGTALQRFFH